MPNKCSKCGEKHDKPTGRKCNRVPTLLDDEGAEPGDTGPDDRGDNTALLQAIQAIRMDIKDVSKRLEKLEEDPGSVHVAGQSVQNTARQETPEQSATAETSQQCTGTNYTPRLAHLDHKLVTSAKTGVFVNLADYLPRVDKVKDNDTSVEASMTLAGSLHFHPRNKAVLDSFHTWLSAWNIYEQVLVKFRPELYFALSDYRQLIQDCDRKYAWESVFAYDVRFRCRLAASPNPFSFGSIDSELFVTILDASAVKTSTTCFRCKSRDHKVGQCPFQAHQPSVAPDKTGPQSKNTERRPTRPTPWYHNNQEGCNNFQFDKCRFPDCTRAHVCRQCRGPEPHSRCKHCNSSATAAGR